MATGNHFSCALAAHMRLLAQRFRAARLADLRLSYRAPSAHRFFLGKTDRYRSVEKPVFFAAAHHA